jgi:hypothetical protein
MWCLLRIFHSISAGRQSTLLADAFNTGLAAVVHDEFASLQPLVYNLKFYPTT